MRGRRPWLLRGPFTCLGAPTAEAASMAIADVGEDSRWHSRRERGCRCLMPWSPPTEPPAHDRRLDPYRKRAARLIKDGQPRGFLLVSVEQVVDRVGGHWWWTTWSRWREFVIAEVAFNDGYPPEDAFWIDQDLDVELDRWSRGELRYLTGPFELEWLDSVESLRIARTVFDVDGWVGGQVDWCGTYNAEDDPAEPPLTVWFGQDLRKARTVRPDLR
jgi:hypothetical protein